MTPTIHTGVIVGGGHCPLPVLSWCPGHTCAENSPSSPSLSLPSPYTPRLDIPAVRKAILYICSSPSGGGFSPFLLPPVSTPCCVFRCTDSDPTAIFSPHSEPFTLTLCISWYVNPSPVITCCPSGAADHPDHLPGVFPQSHSVEQSGQGVERPLHPVRVC